MDAPSDNTSRDALSLADAAALLLLGEDSLRELILMGEIPALSLNRKHIVLLKEDVIEFIRTHARRQQAQKRTAWQSAENHAEFSGLRRDVRKPGRGRAEIPTLSEPTDCRKALLKSRQDRLASADRISARGGHEECPRVEASSGIEPL